MTEDADWSTVLRTMYSSEISRFSRSPQNDQYIEPDHPLVEETGLDHSRFEKALDFLVDSGLLEYDNKDGEWILTESGFTVAHDRRQKRREEQREEDRTRRQNNVNRAIGILTIGLVFTGATDAVIAASSTSLELPTWSVSVALMMNGLVLIVIIDALRRADLLELEQMLD